MSKKYLTIKEASSVLGMSRQAVWYRVQSGLLDAIKMGHIYFIAEQDLKNTKPKKRVPNATS